MSSNLSGAKLLLLLQENEEMDWIALCTCLAIDPALPVGRGFSSLPSVLLFNLLSRLEKVGLVHIEKHPSQDPHARIRLSDNYLDLKKALGISLTDVAKATDPASMVVTPIFGKPDTSVVVVDVFVVMPFNSLLKPIYDDHIMKVVNQLGLTAARADDLFNPTSIIRDIWAGICNAKVIIGECTDRNANVFYEIGMAHVVGKPVILTTRKATDMPFDLQHIRRIEYEFTPRGMEEFERILADTLSHTLGLTGEVDPSLKPAP